MIDDDDDDDDGDENDADDNYDDDDDDEVWSLTFLFRSVSQNGFSQPVKLEGFTTRCYYKTIKLKLSTNKVKKRGLHESLDWDWPTYIGLN